MQPKQTLNIKCAYCEQLNEDTWYSPTSNSDIFECMFCGKNNFITVTHESVKIEQVALSDVEAGFMDTTNGDWTEIEIKRMCKQHLKEIKGLIENAPTENE